MAGKGEGTQEDPAIKFQFSEPATAPWSTEKRNSIDKSVGNEGNGAAVESVINAGVGLVGGQ